MAAKHTVFIFAETWCFAETGLRKTTGNAPPSTGYWLLLLVGYWLLGPNLPTNTGYCPLIPSIIVTLPMHKLARHTHHAKSTAIRVP